MFYVVEKGFFAKKKGFYLLYDNWDDYGYKTTFILYYFDGQSLIKIGFTKIAYKKYQASLKTFDYLEDSFENLSSDFFSLGQDISYYVNLNEFDEKYAEDIKHQVLTGLNDIAYQNKLFFENTMDQATQISLLREVRPLSVTGQFNRVASGGAELTLFDFTFNYKINGTITQLGFHVDPFSIVPTNIHAIIGRNGSGKTFLIKEMLRSFDSSFSSISRFSSEIKNSSNNNQISDIFSKVMCISYSFFDTVFNVIKKDNSCIEYFFWGLKKTEDNSNEIIYTDFENEFATSLVKCFKINKKKTLWIEALNILNLDQEIGDFSISNLKFANYGVYGESASIKERFGQLSSGHKSILSMITKIIDFIEEKTLVIIDEPETHLHPPLLSNFIKALSYILKMKNGVAFIATHSPLILREIPKTNCFIITRFGEQIKIERPIYETYGASINTIMKQSFQLESDSSGFYDLLNHFSEKSNYDINEIRKHLGDEALAYLTLLENTKYEKVN